MVHFLGYTVEDLYKKVVEAARAQGVVSQEQWDDVVEQVIDDQQEFEEMHTDDESEEIERDLRGRWPDYAATLSSEKPF